MTFRILPIWLFRKFLQNIYRKLAVLKLHCESVKRQTCARKRIQAQPIDVKLTKFLTLSVHGKQYLVWRWWGYSTESFWIQKQLSELIKINNSVQLIHSLKHISDNEPHTSLSTYINHTDLQKFGIKQFCRPTLSKHISDSEPHTSLSIYINHTDLKNLA